MLRKILQEVFFSPQSAKDMIIFLQNWFALLWSSPRIFHTDQHWSFYWFPVNFSCYILTHKTVYHMLVYVCTYVTPLSWMELNIQILLESDTWIVLNRNGVSSRDMTANAWELSPGGFQVNYVFACSRHYIFALMCINH